MRGEEEPVVDAPWRTLVTHLTHEDPEQLLASPWNWKIHDGHQRDALKGVLAEIGFAGAVLVNDNTGHVLDGHLRVDLAIAEGAPTVPVLHLVATEAEEMLLLATYDPLGQLAHADREKLAELTAEAKPETDPLKRMLTDLAVQYRPGQVSEAFTRFLNNEDEQEDDDETDDEEEDAGDDDDEPWATSTLTYAFTAEQRAVVLGAVRRYRRSAPGTSAPTALAAICRAYLDGEF